MSAPYHLDAEITGDVKATIFFDWSPASPPTDDEPEGWPPEVWIIDVIPFGVVPPMTERGWLNVADEWLRKRGGYDTCCRHVQEREGTWE